MSSEIPKLCVTYDQAKVPVATFFVLALPRDEKEASLEIKAGEVGKVVASLVIPEGGNSITKGSDFEVARAICDSLPSLRVLLGGDGDDVNFWIYFASMLETSQEVMKNLLLLDSHLKCRTFFVGHSLTLADISIFATTVSCVLGQKKLGNNLFTENTELINLGRWFRLIGRMNPISPKIMKPLIEVDPLPQNGPCQPKPKSSAQNSINLYEGKLPGAIKGKVVTRFPPEPSGYLHIGHAKAALLNDFYAKSYEGRLIVRFDDTNPEKEDMEFELSILEDLKLLGIEPTGPVTHTSDYFDLMMDICEKLIREGTFYCDDTPLEQMRKERGDGIESQCRGNSVEENIRRWNEMKVGSSEGAKNCVRAKIDMSHKNKCMRDPVMYRTCLNQPHHRHGTKYKAYPMYDFACPIVDSLEGVTHAMRTNEYADRIPQYQWVTQATGMTPVVIYEFSRLNFVNTVLSKRKLTWLVETGVVEGWDDPRFPTVRGILRRGLTVKALKEFLFEQGPSKNANLMEWDKLWTKNKQIIDPIIPRFMAVDREFAVKVRIINGPETGVEMRERQLHPKNENVGMGITAYSSDVLMEYEDAKFLTEGEEFTLMRWCNAIVKKIETFSTCGINMEIQLNPDGDFRKTEKKIALG